MQMDLFRLRETQLEVTGRLRLVTDLRVWFCSYRSLAGLAELQNLQTLVIAGYPDETFEAVRNLSRLEYLQVGHLPGVTDLEPLADLTSLSVLRLSTLPSWDSSGRVTEVCSLGPLAKLPRLRHLELFGVRPPSRSLAELEESTSLRTVRVSKYPQKEVRRYQTSTGISDDFAPAPRVTAW